MNDADSVNEPTPTIVGPQPGGREGNRKISIPRGMEKIVALAGMNAEWHQKVLADPLGAASEAGIELSPSERVILGSIPPEALRRMIDGFARSGVTPGHQVGKVAAGAAAAALLVTGLGYTAEGPSAKGGARSDVPPPKPTVGMPAPTGSRPDVPDEAPKVLWMTDLDAAVAQAKKTRRAVMAVFLHPHPQDTGDRGLEVASDGMRPDVPKLSPEAKSQKICLANSKAFRKAVKNSSVLAVKVLKPSAPGFMAAARELTPKEKKEIAAYRKKLATYSAALKKYGIVKKLPAVVFIAPDWSRLSKLEQPKTEKKLVEAIKAVPPLLAKWIVETRKKQKRIYRIAPGIPPRDPKLYSPEK